MKSQRSLPRTTLLVMFTAAVLMMSPFRAMAREVSTDSATLKRRLQEAQSD